MKLYVGNLNYQAKENDLRSLFEQYGEVVSVRLLEDKMTGRAKGFGFVEMADRDGGSKAIDALNGSEFMRRNMVVNEARPPKPREDYRG